MGRRPAGFSSMELNAISPCLHMASVRGIGVALMARTCGACLHSTISSASSDDSDESSSFFDESPFDEEEAFCADEVFPDEDEDDSPPASAQAALSLSSPSISFSASFSFSFSSARFLFSHPDFSLGPATVARSPIENMPSVQLPIHTLKETHPGEPYRPRALYWRAPPVVPLRTCAARQPRRARGT